jgi:transposase
MKKIGGNAVFFSALVAEVIVIWCYNYTNISFLWYNVIGCIIVMTLAYLLEYFMNPGKMKKEPVV